MKNKYFPKEDIGKNDLFFVCYMIERVARHIHQRNRYVVNAIGKAGLYHLLSVANVLHAENPLMVKMIGLRNMILNPVILIITTAVHFMNRHMLLPERIRQVGSKE